MRYYEYTLNTTSKSIENNSKVNLKTYGYDTVLQAVNQYVYQNTADTKYFIYREDANTIKSVLCFDEKEISFADAVQAIAKCLDEIAEIPFSNEEYEEITIHRYYELLCEAKRRGYVYNHRYFNNTDEFVYDNITNEDVRTRCDFLLEEFIVSDKDKAEGFMYDSSLQSEIENIRNHSNDSNLEGNMVHYVISARSFEANKDMAEAILSNLYRAKRLSSRRVEIVTEIRDSMYKRNDYLERVIEGNFGGAVIIDMTEKFGENPVDNKRNCEYIEQLVRKYKNKCLFIFTYNVNHTGFAYMLLPLIQKQVNLLKIKEATGTKEDAIPYLESLIKASEYANYYDQASEYFETIHKNKFTQSDVLDAFNRFESWCINRNFCNAYSFEKEELWLDRDSDTVSSSEALDKLIGLNSVKEQINKILIADLLERERMKRSESEYKSTSLHMVFGGNPGTAKTTVAKLFAGIAKERGLLKSGAFVELSGNTVDSESLSNAFELAKGGVLFIDEAYSICFDFIITELIRQMENNRDEVIVILAGYNERMQNFLQKNEGLKSRIPYWIDFPDYSTDELLLIFELMLNERGIKVTEEVKCEANLVFDKARLLENFGNGRYVRNLVEKAILNQSVRVKNAYENVEDIPEDELFLLIDEDIKSSDIIKQEIRETGTAMRELDEMVGIDSAKRIIHRALASYKMNKLYAEKGIRKNRPSMHMVFTGNPGTAKTTTARLLAEILRDEKILPSGNFVEVGRADLVGTFVGSTAPLVKQRFREARGGVLFIDEAYSLCDNQKNGFGDEAINTIVQEMENHREDVIVIFAGYPQPMKEFLDRNPGMASRIAFQVDFNDYTPAELCEIAELMLKQKGMKITDEAMDKLKILCESVCNTVDFGNGRFVRKALEEAEMNLSQRVFALDLSDYSDELLTTIEACDIEEPKEIKPCKHLGFDLC